MGPDAPGWPSTLRPSSATPCQHWLTLARLSTTVDTMENGSITSADGTTVGYRRFGAAGPAVVLLHGGGQSGRNLQRLAAALAADFTVYVPDRRGRGASGPAGDGYGAAT